MGHIPEQLLAVAHPLNLRHNIQPFEQAASPRKIFIESYACKPVYFISEIRKRYVIRMFGQQFFSLTQICFRVKHSIAAVSFFKISFRQTQEIILLLRQPARIYRHVYVGARHPTPCPAQSRRQMRFIVHIFNLKVAVFIHIDKTYRRIVAMPEFQNIGQRLSEYCAKCRFDAA